MKRTIIATIFVFMTPVLAHAALDGGGAAPGFGPGDALQPEEGLPAEVMRLTAVGGNASGRTYEPASRRDPFLPLEGPGIVPPLKKALLVGIMEVPDSGSIALFQDRETGAGYFMGVGMRFGKDGIDAIDAIDARRGIVTLRRPGPLGLPEYRDIRLHPLEQETQ